MNEGRPVSEEDLHAYVDEALPSARRAAIEAYLAAHPDVAARVARYRRDRAMLRAGLAPIAEEPVPTALGLRALAEARRRPERRPAWRAAAAGLLLFGLGAAGGWSFHGMARPADAGIMMLAQEAADNFAVYGTDRVHPVDFDAGAEDRFSAWLSSRLGGAVMIPDLSKSGYHFMGGRLVATAHGAAGLLMFDDGQGARIVVMERPMRPDKKSTRMAPYEKGEVSGYAWSDDGMGFSLVGAGPQPMLHTLANAVRAQAGTAL